MLTLALFLIGVFIGYCSGYNKGFRSGYRQHEADEPYIRRSF